jgi:hypothetical protein
MVQAKYESHAPQFSERRTKPRLQCSYPARVRGQVTGTARFEAQAILSNLSANGMYLRMKRPLQAGEAIFIVARLSTAPLDECSVPQIAAFGIIQRVEALPGGDYGTAVALKQHRFI